MFLFIFLWLQNHSLQNWLERKIEKKIFFVQTFTIFAKSFCHKTDLQEKKIKKNFLEHFLVENF